MRHLHCSLHVLNGKVKLIKQIKPSPISWSVQTNFQQQHALLRPWTSRMRRERADFSHKLSEIKGKRREPEPQGFCWWAALNRWLCTPKQQPSEDSSAESIKGTRTASSNDHASHNLLCSLRHFCILYWSTGRHLLGASQMQGLTLNFANWSSSLSYLHWYVLSKIKYTRLRYACKIFTVYLAT